MSRRPPLEVGTPQEKRRRTWGCASPIWGGTSDAVPVLLGDDGLDDRENTQERNMYLMSDYTADQHMEMLLRQAQERRTASSGGRPSQERPPRRWKLSMFQALRRTPASTSPVN